ncbi:linear amide C-N hydrolase [Polynucleobacter sp. MWH-Mekk-B1]|uniref:linear amide C-N hydrolase n=1 Tax=Polynucleobacter finlandensis TaxID=1855894 RepID=UPI001C0AAE34|nr:linear amide C-N hydrolase [Polynucleobacter finlandensis]MBU3544329.1 linear amide C-N hydrolase [Polynucleobacter finlandensis]
MKSLANYLVASSLLFSSIGNTIACTAIVVTDLKGNAYHARTMEFSFQLPSSLTYFPVGTRIESATPSGNQGLTFNTKYAILGMTIPAVTTAKQVLVIEGANDQGLSISGNELNNSSAPPVGANPSIILSGADFGAWILGNFKTVAEVKSAMQDGKVEFWLPKIPMVDNMVLPLHYAITDKVGNGLVVEFQNGKKQVYDNPVNVLTNGPEFSWHLTNLNNYTQNNINQNTGQLGKLKLATEDSGIALSALPSSQTAAGRFVKAAFYANYVRKAKTPDEAILTLGHIINNFDRPYDLTVDGPGGVGDGPRTSGKSTEVTDWSVMNDLSRNLLYVRTIEQLNWTVIDMAKLKDVAKIKTVSTYAVGRAGAEAFNLFYQ